MSTATALLVAGIDYFQIPAAVASLRGLCIARYSYLVAKNKDLDFLLFDFAAGTVEENLHGPKRSWNPTTAYGTFKKVTPANYTVKKPHPAFDKNPTGIMSITDVYAAVRKIAAVAPRSLVELTIMSHGWEEGPILVNSDDNAPPGAIARDPNDKDARLKDFFKPNMTPVQQVEFAWAFHPKGICWVFGCNAERMSYKHVFDSMKTSALWKKTVPGKFTDSDVFKLVVPTSDLGEDTLFFPAPVAKQPTASFERTFGEIKAYYARGMEDTYFQRLAVASERVCYGALPGLGASYDEALANGKQTLAGGQAIPPPYMMRIFDLPEFNKFYETQLGIAHDPEARGYGLYSPVKSPWS